MPVSSTNHDAFQAHAPKVVSRWEESSISTPYASSYYNWGRLDFFDHLLESEGLKASVQALGAPASCLDLAAGSGRFCEVLLPFASRIDAVDLEQKHIDLIRSRFPDAIVQTHQSEAFHFVRNCSAAYDVIVVSGLLLFLDDETASSLITALMQKLSPRGFIYVRDFLSKTNSFDKQSTIFADTTLRYRARKFYEDRGGMNFRVSRPHHRFPALENFIFSRLGFPAYRFIWGPAMRKASWLGMPWENVAFEFRAR